MNQNKINNFKNLDNVDLGINGHIGTFSMISHLKLIISQLKKNTGIETDSTYDSRKKHSWLVFLELIFVN